MPTMGQQQGQKSKSEFQERQKGILKFQDFKGMNVQASRQALEDGEFSWLENAMPIGKGNLAVVPTASTALTTNAQIPNTITISTTFSANISGVDYIFGFFNDGSLYAVNVTAGFTVTQIASSSTFSSSGVMATQWKNERLLIIDPSKGYFTYDTNALISNGGVAQVTISAGGTGYSNSFAVTFSGGGGSGAAGIATASGGIVLSVTITNGGSGYTSAPTPVFTAGGGSSASGTAILLAGPATGQSIASYSGHVWVSSNRTINISDTGSFASFSGGVATTLTIVDSTLHNQITALLTANNYLYIFGDDSVDVLGDVQVISGALSFSRTNITASIGTKLATSIFPYYRSVMFAGNTGFYGMVGSTPQKISDKLNPLYNLIDFTKPISGSQVSVYGILCSCFAFTFKDTISPNNLGASRNVLALYFDKKWWLSSQLNNVNLIVGLPLNNSYGCYAWVKNQLFQLFTNTGAPIISTIQTQLSDDKRDEVDKQALKLATGITYSTAATSTASVNVDNEFSSVLTAPSVADILTFINNAGQSITFTGASNIAINFTGSGYVYSVVDAECNAGKYLGVTITATTAQYTINRISVYYADGAMF